MRVFAVVASLLLVFLSPALGQWADDLRLTNEKEESKPCVSNGKALANDTFGGIHILWSDWCFASKPRVYYKCYTPDAGWSGDSLVTPSADSNVVPVIAADRYGNLHAAWQGNDGTGTSQIRYKRRDRTTGWGVLESLTTTNYPRYAPSIAAGGRDSVHLVWYGRDEWSSLYYQIFYRMRTSAGWQPKETLTSGNYYSRYPTVAVDNNGTVHVAWQGRSAASPSYDQIYYRRKPRGGNWSSTEAVTSANTNKYTPSLAVDRNGNVHVVWYEQDGTGYTQIYYACRTSGGWSSPLALTATEHNKFNPSVAVDTALRAHVVWWGNDTNSASVPQIYYRQRTATGDWSGQQRLTFETGQLRERVSIACTREAEPNIVWADSRDGNFEIYYKGPQIVDAGVLSIIQPVGVIDSSASVTPRAIIRNYSSSAQNIRVRISIGASYRDSVTVLVPSCKTDTVNLTNWTAGRRGTYQVVCSTALNGDRNPQNNRRTDSVRVVVRDVGCVKIISPTGQVDSGVSVTPACSVANWGTESVSYRVRMRIGTNYVDSVSVTNHSPGSRLYLTFPVWTARPRDSLTVSCSTRLTGEMVTANDRQTGSVFVRVLDVQMRNLYSPNGFVNHLQTVQCSAQVRNKGTGPVSFRVRLRVGDAAPWVYRDSVQVNNLSVNKDTVLRFANWTADTVGTFGVRCSTMLSGDMVASNNYLTATVVVRAHDVGVYGVLAPVGIIDSEAIVTPRAIIRNVGTAREEGFKVKLRIDAGSFYADSLICTLDVNQTDTIDFTPWRARQRGSHTVKCSTALVGDGWAWNNFQYSSVMVRVRDVAAVQIDVPRGSVDSGSTLTPTAQVLNRGTQTDTFPVWFTIGSSYRRSAVAIVPAGAQRTVSFPNCQLVGRIVLPTACSTALLNDRIDANNQITGVCTLVVRDGQLSRIGAPVGSVDSGVGMAPTASICNLGSRTETFNVTMRIGPSYSNTQSRSLAPGESTWVTFPTWTPRSRSWNAVTCTLALNGDQHPDDNCISDSVFVVVRDVAVGQILSPRGNLAESVLVLPRVAVTNNGNQSAQFRARLVLTRDGVGQCYSDSQDVTLPPATGDTLLFNIWVASPEGGYHALAWVSMSGDMQPGNDSTVLPFSVEEVTTRDVGVVQILQPGGRIYPGQITPKAIIRNLGEASETFWTYFHILRETLAVYRDSAEVIGLAPSEELTLTFRQWCAMPGSYTLKCSTALNADDHRPNDVLARSLQVDSSAPGSWTELAPVPPGPKAKKLKSGSCLAWRPGSEVYCLKANGTAEFYVYNTGDNTWSCRESVPFASEKKKKPGKGACLTYSPTNDMLYMLKGNSTREFWAYDPAARMWTRKQDIPLGPSGKALKGGSALGCVHQEEACYALKGSKTYEFWRYDIVGDSWTLKNPVPGSTSGKPVSDGACLTVDQAGMVFVLKGNNTLEFFAYNTRQDSWYTRTPIPVGERNKRVKAGAGLASDQASLIYALKGNGTGEFYAYDQMMDYWSARTGLPLGMSGKPVKDGGSLVFAYDRLFALKGNNTFEFWSYQPSAVIGLGRQSDRNSQTRDAWSATLVREWITVEQSPCTDWLTVRSGSKGSVRVRLVQVSGRVVQRFILQPGQEVRLNLSSMAAGIYLLTGDAPEGWFVRKVIIGR